MLSALLQQKLVTFEDVGKASVKSCNCSVLCHFMTVNVSRTICIEPTKNGFWENLTLNQESLASEREKIYLI